VSPVKIVTGFGLNDREMFGPTVTFIVFAAVDTGSFVSGVPIPETNSMAGRLFSG
jgi:hypothetical protein